MPEQVCYCGTKMVQLQTCKYRCPNCVPNTTMLLGDNKAIALSKKGDMCIGVSGHTRINRRYQRQYKGEMVRIRAAGLLPIETTPEHPVLVVSSTVRQHRTVAYSAPKWKQAKDILVKRRWKNGDYLVLPRIPGCVNLKDLDLRPFTNENGARVARSKNVPLSFPVNESSAWLLGMYVAEGCTSPKEVVFSLDKKESEIHREIARIGETLGYSAAAREAPTEMRVTIPSRILARALPAWCGSGATNKQIPDFILLNDAVPILRAFLSGYLEGDGSRIRNRWISSSVSVILCMQLQLLCARLGITASVRKISDEGEGLILGKKVRVHEKYRVELYDASKQMRILEKTILVPVKELTTSPFTGSVYNIATADGTFLASNAVVHNCGMIWDCEDVLGLPK